MTRRARAVLDYLTYFAFGAVFGLVMIAAWELGR